MKIDLRGSGLYRDYDDLGGTALGECRLRILDSAIGLLAGGLTGASADIANVASEATGAGCRPMYPVGSGLDLESAAFVNAALLRQMDWMDSYRRHGTIQMGHPSDQMGALFALCNYPQMTGRKLIELTHLSYQLWRSWSDAMLDLSKDGWDAVSKLSLCVPLIAAAFFEVDDDRVNSALALSACNGAVLGGVRRGQISNWKTGLSGYSVARALWCYRLSATYSLDGAILGGGAGNWGQTVSSISSEIGGVDADVAFQHMMIKEFPCYQYGQGAIACAAEMHNELHGELESIEAIVIGVPDRDFGQVRSLLHAERPLAPSSADHHVGYAVATALKHGYLGPGHYARTHLDDAAVERLMDVTEVESIGPESSCAARVLVVRSAGSLEQTLSVAEQTASGMTASERLDMRRAVVLRKANMLSSFSGMDLSELIAATTELEQVDGQELISLVHRAAASATLTADESSGRQV